MCTNPLKRKVASKFLNILAQFLTHYQHFCKKKKVMRHPKVRREGTRNNFVFLCGLTQEFHISKAHNWPKFKGDFLENWICFCHKINKAEEVGLSLSKYCKTIAIFMSMSNFSATWAVLDKIVFWQQPQWFVIDSQLFTIPPFKINGHYLTITHWKISPKML